MNSIVKVFIFLLGPPGVGKGTHAYHLYRYYSQQGFSCKIIETGKYFRETINSGETLFKQFLRKMMGNGEILPAALPMAPFMDALFEDREYDIYIVDGMCRSIPEVKLINRLLDVFPAVQKKGVYINVPPDVIKQRLLERNRGDDDSIKVVETRLEHFEKFTAPTIRYLKKGWPARKRLLDSFWEVNGDRPEEEVHQEILSHLTEQDPVYDPAYHFHKAP